MPSRPQQYRPTALAKPAPRASANDRGYDRRWRQARLSFLAEHPLCIRCQAEGKVTEATVVDHVRPHRGDQKLFWDRGNWQPLCKRCHDVKTNAEDRER